MFCFTTHQALQVSLQVLLTIAFILWPLRTCGFGIREKIRCGLRIFWRISVRFCGFRTSLTPPSILVESEFGDVFFYEGGGSETLGVRRQLTAKHLWHQGPVSRKPRKVFGTVKPFLDHLYLKTEKCIRLKLLV